MVTQIARIARIFRAKNGSVIYFFFAAQEINQINLNLGAKPRNRVEDPWMALFN